MGNNDERLLDQEIERKWAEILKEPLPIDIPENTKNYFGLKEPFELYRR